MKIQKQMNIHKQMKIQIQIHIQIVSLQLLLYQKKDTNTKDSSPTSISPRPNLTFPKFQPPKFLES